ncbi:hypothetical protein EUGRSUZ_C01402 [Eucalyptus grandis]|uniref:Uncharacterized protein n=2 Tax=Eucalyptus grandis TaxID=71139 RepID=A0ACC3LCZ5_EUCGR|nr:hypothetical protein EUGRSUZ_C01402 [Eucalyptus grandis]
MGKLSGSKSSRHGVNTLSQNHRRLPALPFLSCPLVIDYSTFVNFIVQKQVLNLRTPTKMIFYVCRLLPALFSVDDIFYFTRAVEGDHGQQSI